MIVEPLLVRGKTSFITLYHATVGSPTSFSHTQGRK